MHNQTSRYDSRLSVSYFPIPKKCKNCGADVIFTSNAVIYGEEKGNGKCYLCTNRKCDSYVGVHDETKIPLGILANKRERNLKKRCHEEFDELWTTSSDRSIAYKWLAGELGIPVNKCHFGWFEEKTLIKALKILERRRRTYELSDLL